MNQRCLPMLATRGAPFDSEEYLFEVKWNGIGKGDGFIPKEKLWPSWAIMSQCGMPGR